VVEGLRFSGGVSGFQTSADVLRDGPCELAAEPCRDFALPSTRVLADRDVPRDDSFRFGDADASGDNEGKEVKTFGEAGFASELVRRFPDPAAAIWEVERFVRTPLGSILFVIDLCVTML
jgi:hypothetical protein